VYPTAVHLVAEAQETPVSVENLDGLGVAWTFHLLPFQCSASVPP